MIKINFSKIKTKSEGQSLIEVLFAVGVVALCMVALTAAVATGIRNARFAKSSALASQYADEALEMARKERDSKTWDDFSDYSGCWELDSNNAWHNSCQWDNPTGYCAGNGSYSIDVIFTRCVNFSLNGDKMTVEARVVWSEGSRNHKAETTSFLTKWGN